MDEQYPSTIRSTKGRAYTVENVAAEGDIAVQNVAPISDLRVLPDWRTVEGYPVKKNSDGSYVVKTEDGEVICEEVEE